jgi:hypothetical protein
VSHDGLRDYPEVIINSDYAEVRFKVILRKPNSKLGMPFLPEYMLLMLLIRTLDTAISIGACTGFVVTIASENLALFA